MTLRALSRALALAVPSRLTELPAAGAQERMVGQK